MNNFAFLKLIFSQIQGNEFQAKQTFASAKQ